MPVDLIAQREANIAANMRLLMELGIQGGQNMLGPKSSAPKNKKSKPKPAARKRTRQQADNDDFDPDADDNQPIEGDHEIDDGQVGSAKKRKRPTGTATDADGKRRSARNTGKPKLDYNKERNSPPVKTLKRSKKKKKVTFDDDSDDSGSYYTQSETEDDESRGLMRAGRSRGNGLGKRIHNPKTFGHIPGIPVGTWWAMRKDCSTDAVHAPFVAGIHGHPEEGAYSVALSGGYEDDVDLGFSFTYTGAGGRDLKGTPENRKNLRTAPQSSNQSFDNTLNKCLKSSVRTGNPVRVIRGFKLQSEFAPKTGYRYDGLYKVEKAWMEKGLNPGGFMVCKYALTRLPDQDPMIWGKDQNSDEDEDEEEEEGSCKSEGEDEADAKNVPESASETAEDEKDGDVAMKESDSIVEKAEEDAVKEDEDASAKPRRSGRARKSVTK